MNKNILCGITLFAAVAANAFDDFYVGPVFSSATEQHSIDSSGMNQKQNHDHKKADIVIGKGFAFTKYNVPFYVGGEVHIPLKNTNHSQDVTTLLGGQQQKHKHSIKKQFPFEASVKFGYFIDKSVVLFGKIGFVHQKTTHEVPTLNHKESANITSPVYGFGVMFTINGKWVVNGEFIAHGDKDHNHLIFKHKEKHHRVQMTLAYRF